jgi:acyl-CoA synthetase (AMP-forming)/AMP-acid ligase II/thioesterase domain-containing protein
VDRIGAFLERPGALEPRADAILAPGRRPLMHGALGELVSGVAAGLAAVGLAEGSRIALMVENGPEAACAFLALAQFAAVAPLNPAYRAQELAFYLDDIRADAIVVDATLDTPARNVAQELGIRVLELTIDATAPAGIFEIDGVSTDAPFEGRPDPDAVALLLHTSGTTARPKLVPLTHRQLAASAANVAETLGLRPVDRCLNVMPLFHIHGLVAALLASLRAGAAVACAPGFHQLHFFDWVEELAPTWYTAVPTMHAAVLARASDHAETVARHRLRFIRSSSAALPVPVLEGLEATFGVPVIEAYGMTEAAHQMASNPLPPAVRKPGTVGCAAGPELAVLDPDGHVLPPGEIGEVAVHGPNVFAGYEANPEANDTAFSNGWFRTGDEGSLDDDGYLTLRGRIKEIINRGGEKISPLEVDDALLRHPAVGQAVTFSLADPLLGEEVAAAVVVAAGSATGERDLQDFVAQQLAPFKVPRRIVVVDEIPKGPTGKVQRVGLADRLGVAGTGRAGARDDRPPYGFLEHELVAIWESVLGIPGVGVADDFFALGGDSILGAEAVARVRELVGDPDLPLTSIVRAPTPGAMAHEVFAGIGVGRSGVIPLQASGTRTPLFLVHPGDGDVLAYPVLARLLGPEQPSYALRANGIDDGRPTPSSLDELAADYVGAVRQVQPHGPYALGGFCLGGPIAAEMAAQLAALGEETAVLILLDPRFRRPDGLRYTAWLAGRRIRQGRLTATLAGRLGRRDKGSPERDPSVKTACQADLARIRETHRPRPVDVLATVVLSDGFDDYDLPDWYLRSVIRRPRRWERVGGEHGGLLLPPRVHEVAREIRSALDEALPGGTARSGAAPPAERLRAGSTSGSGS